MRAPTAASSAAFLRVNYLASIAWATLGLILLLVYPFDHRLLSPLVVLAALPYFVAQAATSLCGYRRLDVVRIYGFNLLLLPVNLAGVLKSVNQALTGRKSAYVQSVMITYALRTVSWTTHRPVVPDGVRIIAPGTSSNDWHVVPSAPSTCSVARPDRTQNTSW